MLLCTSFSHHSAVFLKLNIIFSFSLFPPNPTPTGLGAVFVNQLLKWEAQVEQDLDKMLEKAKAANERRYIDGDDD